MTNEKYLKGRFQQKIDTEENWNKAKNFVPLDGEIIVYRDLNKIKIGDGASTLDKLQFATGEGGAGIVTEEGGVIFSDYENNRATAQGSMAAGWRQDRSGAPDVENEEDVAPEDWRYNEALGTGATANGMGAVAYSRASKSLGYRTQAGYPPNAEEAGKRPEAVQKMEITTKPFRGSSFSDARSYVFCDPDGNIEFNLSPEPLDDMMAASNEGYGVVAIELTDDAPVSITYEAEYLTSSGAYLPFLDAVVFNDLNYDYTDSTAYKRFCELGFPRLNEPAETYTCELNIPKGYKYFGIMAQTLHGQSGMDSIRIRNAVLTYKTFPEENIGQAAVAIGSDTAAVGSNSLAGGWKSKATGSRAMAIGSQVVASGEASVAFGDRTQANGDKSIAVGMLSKANGSRSIAAGHTAIADADVSFAFGNNVQTNAHSQTVIGKFNTPDADALFVVGNGWDNDGDGRPAVTSNAFVVKEYGDVFVSGDIYTNGTQLLATQDYTNTLFYEVPVKKTATGGLIFGGHANNDANANSIAFGGSTANGPVKATAQNAVALGEKTTASGRTSLATGLGTTASGSRSAAFGNSTAASGITAMAIGDTTTAEGHKSFAAGWLSKASGQQSMAVGRSATTTTDANAACALGLFTQANAEGQIAVGKYNVFDKDAIFIVGNGVSSGRSNALTVKTSGDMNIAGEYGSTGADYAEMFEWTDGNPDAEDRIGYVVTLEGDKIRLAQTDDDVLGVISGTAALVGDSASLDWKDRYVTDEFGRIVYDMVEEFEDIEDPETNETTRVSLGFAKHPRVNPEYDPTSVYIPREERPEWGKVGMMGKLYVRDDGTCVVGGYCAVSVDGILTHSETPTNIRAMKRTGENIIWVLLK